MEISIPKLCTSNKVVRNKWCQTRFGHESNICGRIEPWAEYNINIKILFKDTKNILNAYMTVIYKEM